MLRRLVTILLGALSLISAAGVVLMLLHIALDVVLRTSGVRFYGTVEIVSGYYMPLIAFLPLAWVERQKQMIVIEVFNGLYTPRGLQINDAIVAVFTAAVYALLCVMTLEEAMGKFGTQAFLMSASIRVPIWFAFFLPPIGFGLAALVSLLNAFDVNMAESAESKETSS